MPQVASSVAGEASPAQRRVLLQQMDEAQCVCRRLVERLEGSAAQHTPQHELAHWLLRLVELICSKRLMAIQSRSIADKLSHAQQMIYRAQRSLQCVINQDESLRNAANVTAPVLLTSACASFALKQQLQFFREWRARHQWRRRTLGVWRHLALSRTLNVWLCHLISTDKLRRSLTATTAKQGRLIHAWNRWLESSIASTLRKRAVLLATRAWQRSAPRCSCASAFKAWKRFTCRAAHVEDPTTAPRPLRDVHEPTVCTVSDAMMHWSTTASAVQTAQLQAAWVAKWHRERSLSAGLRIWSRDALRRQWEGDATSAALSHIREQRLHVALGAWRAHCACTQLAAMSSLEATLRSSVLRLNVLFRVHLGCADESESVAVRRWRAVASRRRSLRQREALARNRLLWLSASRVMREWRRSARADDAARVRELSLPMAKGMAGDGGRVAERRSVQSTPWLESRSRRRASLLAEARQSRSRLLTRFNESVSTARDDPGAAIGTPQ